MDPYHHQWRPFPCPTCTHLHFPFCPPPSDPPPPPPPPPPLYPQNPTNQFPYPQLDPYPNPNPNPYYPRPRPGLHPPPPAFPIDPVRFHKRPRVDTEDERRLKLIRDHGATWAPPAPVDLNNYAYTNNNSFYSPFNPNSNGEYPNLAYGSPGFRGYFTPPPPPPPQPPRGYENGGYYVHAPPPPPLPASPPPPPPQPLHSSPEASFSLFPVPVSSSLGPSSGGAVSEEWGTLTKQYVQDNPMVVDASHLFKQSYRVTRPGHLVIILRGLPGSGKSYIAKMMRDLEVENGGEAPRIHSMDDYFLTEVEKVEDVDASKSSNSTRGKKPVVKKVMEYCYEPEMEEAYRESMLKAFKKTLDEGIFTLVIVDDRNLRVADFAQFWAIAKRSGYEVYISEAPYKDPAGCAARNVHGFTLAQIQKMAHEWEEAPSFYLQLSVKSLFHGDDLKESGIQEFDMDAGDGDLDHPLLPEEKPEKAGVSPLQNEPLNGDSENRNRWHNEEDHHGGTKELGKSKWSNNIDEEDAESSVAVKGNLNALSGLIQAYGKRGKSVRWSDQAGDTGFSIGAAMRKSMLSLVIGPGAGYNLKSNPLPASESSDPQRTGRSRNQNVFQDQIRAERESTKAVFDRRRQRIASGEE